LRLKFSGEFLFEIHLNFVSTSLQRRQMYRAINQTVKYFDSYFLIIFYYCFNALIINTLKQARKKSKKNLIKYFAV